MKNLSNKINCYLPYVAHKNPTIDTVNLIKNNKLFWLTINIIRHTIRAMAVGSRQYPRTQTLWKKDLERT